MWFTFAYYKGEYFLMRSRLWSDFAAHLPMIRSFSLGDNFPPEYPQFANEPSRYHFLFYMLVGYMERIGINLAFALNTLSAIGLSLLLIMIFKFAEYFYGVKKKGAIFAGVLAVFFFLFNSSLSYVDYFQEKGVSLATIAGVVQVEQFINFGPWNGDDISAFWHWNVYTNQRHLAFSYALVLCIFWTLLRFSAKKKNQLSKTKRFLMILTMIVLPFFNLAAYAILLYMLFFWFVTNPSLIKKRLLFYLLLIVVSIPSFYCYWQLDVGKVIFSPGFMAAEKNLWGIIYYWWRNLGLYIILWPSLLVVGNKQQKKWLLMVAGLFLVANLFQLSTDMINNHKLINFFQLGIAVSLGVLLAKLWSRSLVAKLFVILLIPLLTLSGVMDASAIIHDRQVMLPDVVNLQLGIWVINNTAADSVFVTNQYLYNPVSLVGRKTYLDYGYFAWSMGYQDRPRRENLLDIFAPDSELDRWCHLMTKEQIDYVMLSPGKGDFEFDPRDSWLVLKNSPIYEMDEYQIFSTKTVCSSQINRL